MGLYDTKIHTKDGYDLEQILEDSLTTLNVYKEEVPNPFRDMFVEEVPGREFQANLPDEMRWDEIGEQEPLATFGEGGPQYVSFGVRDFGLALNWNREFIERNTRQKINEKFQVIVDAYDNGLTEDIVELVKGAAADGSTDKVWYEPQDIGEYGFDKTHDHTFASTAELMEDDEFADADAGTGASYSVVEHVHQAASHLRHHRKTPTVCLVSSQLKRKLLNELTWDASYYFPEANGLRSQSLEDADAVVDGIRFVETPWLNDLGSAGYTFYVASTDNPLVMNDEIPPELVQNQQGHPITGPHQLFTAYGYARYGMMVKDPFAVVKATADNIATS